MAQVRSVLITGCGIICAIGNGKDEVLSSLMSNRTGIGPLKYLRTTHTEFPVGEVKMSDNDMEQAMGIEPGTPVTRTALMGMIAMHEALDVYVRKITSLPELNPRAAMQDMAQKFAAELESIVRLYPTQWFNYYDFWNA